MIVKETTTMTILQQLIAVLRAAPGFYAERLRDFAQLIDEQGKYVGWLATLHADAEQISAGVGDQAVSHAMALHRTLSWPDAVARVRFELGLSGAS